jgi:hypothetical protein
VVLVTVWGASDVFFHTTVCPALIVIVAGPKTYFLLTSFASTFTGDVDAAKAVWPGDVVAILNVATRPKLTSNSGRHNHARIILSS